MELKLKAWQWRKEKRWVRTWILPYLGLRKREGEGMVGMGNHEWGMGGVVLSQPLSHAHLQDIHSSIFDLGKDLSWDKI